jgi:hypothetical protein
MDFPDYAKEKGLFLLIREVIAKLTLRPLNPPQGDF